MGKIFKGQTALIIRLTTNQDITGATVYVKYKKPSGATGSWPASITTASTGVISYAINNADDLDEVGVWTFWAYVEFADGTVAAGEPITKEVYKQGN